MDGKPLELAGRTSSVQEEIHLKSTINDCLKVLTNYNMWKIYYTSLVEIPNYYRQQITVITIRITIFNYSFLSYV